MANATLMATIVALQVRPAKAQGHDFAEVVFGFAALGFLAFLWLLWGIVSWLCRRRPAQEPPEEEAAQVEERAATPPPPRAARQRKALARATGARGGGTAAQDPRAAPCGTAPPGGAGAEDQNPFLVPLREHPGRQSPFVHELQWTELRPGGANPSGSPQQFEARQGRVEMRHHGQEHGCPFMQGPDTFRHRVCLHCRNGHQSNKPGSARHCSRRWVPPGP